MLGSAMWFLRMELNHYRNYSDILSVLFLHLIFFSNSPAFELSTINSTSCLRKPVIRYSLLQWLDCRLFGLGGVDALQNPPIEPRLGLSYYYPTRGTAGSSIVPAPGATNSANVPKNNVTIEHFWNPQYVGDVHDSTKRDEPQVMGGNNTLTHGDHGQRKQLCWARR